MAKQKLVDNWRTAYRWYTMHVAGAIVLAAAAWESLPEATRDAIPDKYKPLAVALGGVLVMAARLIQQKKPAGQSDNSDGQG
mgnify:FL=1